jgi:hypothetical protein
MIRIFTEGYWEICLSKPCSYDLLLPKRKGESAREIQRKTDIAPKKKRNDAGGIFPRRWRFAPIGL